MGNISSHDLEYVSQMFFYHRVYLNGEQILLENENLERFCRILEENQTFPDIEKKIRKIFNIPKDAELLNNNEEISNNYFSFPIYNFYSRNLYMKEKTKNRKHSSLNDFSELKSFDECEKYKLFLYPQNNEENLTDLYSVILLGFQGQNILFINGFLNFIFDINENDGYRLVLDTQENNKNDNKDKKESFFDKKIISAKKGNFLFICINVDKSPKENDIIQFLEYIRNKEPNLILFNTIFNYPETNYEIDISEKNNTFFACPNVFYDYLKFSILRQEFESLKSPESKDKIDPGILTKEDILQIAKSDESLRQKLVSCNFIYDSIFSKEKNKDIFFKYQITMRGYEYFYDVLVNRKNITIDFSLITNYLSLIYENRKNIEKQEKSFSEKKGENWTEYYLYEMSIDKLNKQIKEKQSEIDDLNHQKEEKNNQCNKNLKKIQNEIDNMKFYNTLVQKNPSILLPVTSENLENNIIIEGIEHNVCKICKHTCHINCDELIKAFCKCFKFQLSGFKCKVCPNKCFSGSHEVVSYQYPKYEYKKIDDILQPYLTPAQKKISLRKKIIYVIGLKEAEKRNLLIEKEKTLKNLDAIIEERKKCIDEYSALISKKTDKKNNIYENNKIRINEEIKKYNSLIKFPKNMKWYEILFIQTFCEFLKAEEVGNHAYSGGGRCC